MNTQRPSSRRRACVRCVRLKVRCSPIEDGTVCKRCARLARGCVFPDTFHLNAPKDDRIDRLQEQLDGLAAQIAKKNGDTLGPCMPNTSQVLGPLPLSTTPSDIFTRGLLTVTAAERLLEKYRVYKMAQFPFVIIPLELDISTLRQDYPFLLITILTASLEDDLPLQRELEVEVKTGISTRIIMGNERNLDILLGLLVHVAWYHYHWQTMHTQLYLLLQMAIMVVVDLGLDRDENFGMRAISTSTQHSINTSRTSHHTSAGKRGLLACYYLCSVSAIFRKQLFMRHTRWIDQCCEELAAKAEYPTDALLKTYINIQSLSRRSEEAICANDRDGAHGAVGPSDRNTLLDSLQAQGKRIQEGCPNNFQNHWALFLELKAVPIYILGHVLRHKTGTSWPNYTATQLSTLFSSTYALVTFFLETPLDTIVHLPVSSFTTLWYSLLVLSKLALSEGTAQLAKLAAFTHWA